MSKDIGTCKRKLADWWKALVNVCKTHPIYIPYALLIVGCLIAMWRQSYAWCFGLSLVVALFPAARWLIPKVVWLCAKYIFKSQKFARLRSRGHSPVWLWTVHFIVAACILQFAVNGYEHYLLSIAEKPTPMPALGVQLFSALFSAIRSVGIIETYFETMQALHTAWAGVFSGFGLGGHLYSFYATALYAAMPLAGSAFILGVFAQVIPSFMLWLQTKNIFREKCYFSGLNVQSLALAKSLLEEAKTEGKGQPLIVFTDAYVDDESEQSSELMLEAKRIGAICVRDDLAHVRKTVHGMRKYFLMEENEYDNLPGLMSLMEERNIPYVKDAIIYVFVQGDLYMQLEENWRQKWIEEEGKLTKETFPAIIPVNAHRNLVNNLMATVPLYEPLVGQNTNQLTITILGDGSIGMEAFLSAYWFSRMMACRKNEQGEDVMEECEITIHVVSQDEPKTFWGKIESVNAEILRTIQADDPLLEWRPGQRNRPYCTVYYHKADVKTATENDDTGKKTHSAASVWMDANYVIVALGDDASNISVANNLRARIGKSHLEQQGESKNTVIAYVVYNSELCQALNRNNKAEYGVYMYAFGHLDQVYSGENVFMTKNQLLAEEAHKAYYGHSAGETDSSGKRAKPSRTYSQLAEMARAMHIKYKIFSLGWITTSLFITAEESDHQEAVEKAYAQYKRVAKIGRTLMTTEQLYSADALPQMKAEVQELLETTLSAEDLAKWQDLCKKRHRLAWLEHRRWCAYTRTMGYRFTDAMDKYYLVGLDHKNMSLKLHPCLVEARLPSADTSPTYVFTHKVYWKQLVEDAALWQVDDHADALDVHHLLRWRAMTAAWDVLLKEPLASYEALAESEKDQRHYKRVAKLKERMDDDGHCKYYDYFVGEFPEYELSDVFCTKMQDVLSIVPEEWEKQCEQWRTNGAFVCENGDVKKWVVPVDCAKAYITARYPLSFSVKEYACGYPYAEGVLPSPFVLEYKGEFYAADTPENREALKNMEAECEKAAHRALSEAEAAMQVQ